MEKVFEIRTEHLPNTHPKSALAVNCIKDIERLVEHEMQYGTMIDID
jgi:hypothetical protein